MKLNKNLASGALAFGLILGLAACAEGMPGRTPQQVWIDAHPTTLSDDGECMEFDGEPCDDDPYDLDDWYESYHKTPAVKKESPRPMKTANQPVKTPGPLKTTKRR